VLEATAQAATILTKPVAPEELRPDPSAVSV
jgi:hypothetical protein